MISTVKVRFLRSGKSLIFLPKWKKASLRVSVDSVRITLRACLVDYSVVLVSLKIFSNVGIIFSKDIPCFVIQADFLQH